MCTLILTNQFLKIVLMICKKYGKSSSCHYPGKKWASFRYLQIYVDSQGKSRTASKSGSIAAATWYLFQGKIFLFLQSTFQKQCAYFIWRRVFMQENIIPRATIFITARKLHQFLCSVIKALCICGSAPQLPEIILKMYHKGKIYGKNLHSL